MRYLNQFSLAAAVLAISLSACRKDRTCECTYNDTFTSTNPRYVTTVQTSKSSTVYKDVKKNNRILESCKDGEWKYTYSNEEVDNNNNTVTYENTGVRKADCELK